jgi:hypothetical protein
MKQTCILWLAAWGLAWGAACAFGQQRAIQPSPAYRPAATPVYYPPAPAVRPAPAAPQPVYYVPVQPGQPVQGQPVYYVPQPAQRMPAPAPVYEEDEDAYEEEVEEEEYDVPLYIDMEEEEGLYWFWGSKWPGLALGPKFGTTGLGLDLTFGISRWLNLRGGFNYGLFTWSPTFGDVDYELESNLMSGPLFVDVHPFANHFRISGGIYIQPGSDVDLSATPNRPVQIGRHTYAPDVVGTLSGTIEIADAIGPYVGIGFGNSVDEEQVLTFMVDFGVVFQSYEVSLTSDGAGMTTPVDTFRTDLELEEQNIEDDVNSLKVFPVLTFGISYHF